MDGMAYKQVSIDADHPVAQLFGVRGKRGRPKVYAHKLALYEKIGPGDHPCHWCAATLAWRRGTSAGTLLVDHLDSDQTNNDPANLVPACNGCNTIRARTKFRPAISDDELTVATHNGARTRGVELRCEMCGNTFVAHITRVRRGTAKTCSKRCAGDKGRAARWGTR